MNVPTSGTVSQAGAGMRSRNLFCISHAAGASQPEAFAAFLPAYLLRALDDLEGRTVVLEFTTYSLSPYDSDGDVERQKRNIQRLVTRARVMTVAQIGAVRDFLQFVSVHAKRADCFQPFLEAALEEVWRTGEE